LGWARGRGLSANVGDDEEAMILIAESGGRSLVVEGAIGLELGATDTYCLRLSRAPALGKKVVIAVVPAGLSPEEEARNFADLQVWDRRSTLAPVLGRQPYDWSSTDSNWSTGVEIMFRAKTRRRLRGAPVYLHQPQDY